MSSKPGARSRKVADFSEKIMRQNKDVRSAIDATSSDHVLERFQAKHALGLDPGVDTGSPSENATTQGETERSPIPPEQDSF
jgi:hypothetical protein